jgi:alpha-beta hydrolase superfamily lysophospholipase
VPRIVPGSQDTVRGSTADHAAVDLRVSLGADFRLGAGLSCAIRVLPPATAGRPRGLLFCFPGGGYSKDYFDLHFAGRDGYSMAEYLADRGYLVVLCDHLGVGDSSHPPDAAAIRPEDLAAANSRVVAAVTARLADGSLHPGLAPLDGLPRIAIAHSMGGGILTIQQSRHEDFDALVMMGWSASHLPSSAELAAADGAETFAATPPLEGPPRHPGYARVNRGPLQHHWYHWDDVPSAVIEADDALAVEFPPCARLMNLPGIVASDAAAISVPVHILMGERDLREPGSDETAAYPASRSVAYFELHASGHCHNLAGSRREGWARVADWCDAVAADAASGAAHPAAT